MEKKSKGFESAMVAISEGKRVRRSSWPKESMLYQEALIGGQYSFQDEKGQLNMGVKQIKFFCLEISQSNYYMWHPTQTDMGAGDWVVIDEVDKA